MTNDKAMEIVERWCESRGYRVNPRGLTALHEYLATRKPSDHAELATAYALVMDGFRRLFAPKSESRTCIYALVRFPAWVSESSARRYLAGADCVVVDVASLPLDAGVVIYEP